MADQAELDHIAIAAQDLSATLPRYAEGTGIVVQIVQVQQPSPISPVPDDVTVPPTRVNHAAHVDWIGHAVASLDEGVRLFGAILGGAETARGVSDADLGAEWVELEWPEHGRLRLFAPCGGDSPLT